jgi:Domain of unknown function (DUF4136)
VVLGAQIPRLKEASPKNLKRAEKKRLQEAKGEIMKVKSTIFFSIAMFFVLTAASFADQVKTDYDHNANFGQYKTYSWEKVQTKDPLLVDRIKSAVNASLAAKGLTEVPSGGDISVVAMEITKKQQTLNTFYDGFGGGWRWGGFGDATTTTETYKVGTLVVDLFDANSKNLIWRGSSSDTLSNNPNKNTKNLDKGVQKMFAHFPPEAKK